MSLAELDGFDARLSRRAEGALRAFNEAGVLTAADVHVASRLARLSGGAADATAVLAAAFAVRAPRLGHVCVDLETIRSTANTDLDVVVDLQALPWPAPEEWTAAVAASPLVGDDRPLHLEGSTLYLDRYWREERQVATDLLSRAALPAEGVDTALLASGLARLFAGGVGGEEPDLQRLAAASSVLRRVAVIAGGPGTGKTTTVARVLALFHEQAAAVGARPPLVGLAAPTGKAAARLEEAVHDEAAALPIDADVRARLMKVGGMTLHRLLGFNPANRSRFRHHRLNRLAHDVIVVDEASMVALTLMARLVEALRADTHLILVGDPEQLASVEAGAVLGDVVGPAGRRLLMRPAARAALASVAGGDVPAADPPSGTPIGDGIVVLRRVHRFGGGIARLAEAIQLGDEDATIDVLGSAPDGAGDGDGDGDVRWLARDVAAHDAAAALGPVRAAAVSAGRRVVEAATAGRAGDALEALGAFRLLCAHRRGPCGAATWMEHVERWLAAEVEGFGAGGVWYPGRPLLVTENDYSLRLFNGDTGVVVATPSGRVVAAFERGGEVVEVSPTRLASVDTVHAMTVHKAQGSQFDTVAVLLPAPDSPILTRELLYTAVTRARRQVILAGTEAAVRTAVGRPIARASGLRRALWG